MLEDVRIRLMQKLFERHEAVNAQASVLMPRVESIISRRRIEVRSVRVFRSGHYEYQTRGNDLVDNVTKMDAKTCTVEQKYWAPVDHNPVRPPAVRRRLGRPIVSRRREEDEASPSHHGPLEHKTIRCFICGGTGHNRRNCRAPPPSGNNTNVDVPAPEQAQIGRMVRRKLPYIMRGGLSTHPVHGTMGMASSSMATPIPPTSEA
uniref:CCHC-type domain-containing protein n=1 Tax=Nelumbo nucifera TaxID=4432 RepID=A0A822ZLX6_NELNU|nr:TPA_asm: hypothetical protein HUJ06_004127 [Nelumbo nucifera]